MNIEGDTREAGAETAAVEKGRRKIRRNTKSIITSDLVLDRFLKGGSTQMSIGETLSTSLEIWMVHRSLTTRKEWSRREKKRKRNGKEKEKKILRTGQRSRTS